MSATNGDHMVKTVREILINSHDDSRFLLRTSDAVCYIESFIFQRDAVIYNTVYFGDVTVHANVFLFADLISI